MKRRASMDAADFFMTALVVVGLVAFIVANILVVLAVLGVIQ